MSNFTINFSHPWLLFLLIPAVIILVVAMLRVPKKYRNTRNRVVSVVLESIVLLCAVLLLSGMTFAYTTGNTQNEIILLVDVTDTMDSSAQNRDDYVQSLLYRAEDNDCQVGIVTFGFTQVYAAPLSTDYDSVYRRYKSAPLPDTSATDLSAAMEYAAKLFTNPETSKIVIISDGKETDESAVSTLSAITSQGTLVESVYIPTAYEGFDIQIVDVEMPNYHVNAGDTVEITLDISTNYVGDVQLYVTDNGNQVDLLGSEGSGDDGGRAVSSTTKALSFRLTLYEKYLHAINISIGNVDEEILTQNNSYCVYIYIDNYNRILIFEPNEGESAELVEALQSKTPEEGEEEAYEITVLTLSDYTLSESMWFPVTVDELRQYDLVILNNTSNADMYAGYLEYLTDTDQLGDFYSYFYTSLDNEKSGGGLLPQLLYTYVYTYGGGLLTVGGVTEGENGELVANMYKRSDMYGTVLQQMLPITAINYTPPTGVVVVIDTSGSMGSGDGSLLALAINGVLMSLNLLSTRDYMGIVEFSTEAHLVLSITSLMYSSVIQEELNYLKEHPQSGGTALYDSYRMAIQMLEDDSSLYERKHIIIVTDGLLSDSDEDLANLSHRAKGSGITVTSIVVGGGSSGLETMRKVCEEADGADNVVLDSKFLYDCSDASSEGLVGDKIYEDIQAMVWEEINYEELQIQVSSTYIFSPLVSGLFVTSTDEETGETVTDLNHLDATLTRFYGTTAKSGASVILTGDFSVPIYAQWSCGEGMVGSFMGDVHKFGDYVEGDTSYYILSDAAGVQFMINVVDNLMPSDDIRPNGLTVSLSEDNYTNRLNVYADVEEGWTVDANVYAWDDDDCESPLLDLNKVTDGDTDGMDMYVTVAMTEANNYSRANFVIKTSGVYKIVVTLKDETGAVVVNEMGTPATTTIYKVFSYSAEYNNFNAGDGLALLDSLSTGELGAAITDADDLVYVFSDLVTRISKTVDPRLPLIIIALVLFLLGIAVRKFKWKWIHELVHDRKEKKENSQKK